MAPRSKSLPPTAGRGGDGWVLGLCVCERLAGQQGRRKLPSSAKTCSRMGRPTALHDGQPNRVALDHTSLVEPVTSALPLPLMSGQSWWLLSNTGRLPTPCQAHPSLTLTCDERNAAAAHVQPLGLPPQAACGGAI